MASTITAEELDDLVKGTLKDLGRLKFNQIATTLQTHEVWQRIMKKDKVQFQDGVGIQFNMMVNHSDSARQVGLYAVDDVDVPTLFKQLSIPWRHTTANWPYEFREMLMNRGASRIIDVIKSRRTATMIAVAIKLEEQFWNKPTNSSDELEIFGVPYWIVKNSSVGHNGGDPSGFSSGAAGLTVASESGWNNYSGAYVNVTKDDLITKMRTAYRKIRFQSPVDIPDYRNGRGDSYRIYMNESTINAFETLAELQNENLGRDLAPMDEVTAFKRNPVIWIPFLDADTSNPVYMINFQKFHPVFLKGDFLRETGPIQSPKQHNVREVHTDLTWNVLCTDRRSQAVLHVA